MTLASIFGWNVTLSMLNFVSPAIRDSMLAEAKCIITLVANLASVIPTEET
jgi:hypothetical protein